MIFYRLNLLKSVFNRKGFCDFKSVGDKKLGEIPVCPHCGINLGPKPWLPPFKVKLRGRHFGDLCADGTGYDFLISRDIFNAWEKSDLTGLQFYSQSVHIIRAGILKNMIAPEYIVARPDIVLTQLNEKESGLVIKRFVGCEKCRVASRLKVEKLRIDESTWQGHDIFYPSGLYGVLVVSERFVEFVENNKFTNFVFIHQDDYNYEQDS